MKRLADSYCVDFTVRLAYKAAVEMDDIAEELGCSIPKVARAAIKWGIENHKDEIINEIMEEMQK